MMDSKRAADEVRLKTLSLAVRRTDGGTVAKASGNGTSVRAARADDADKWDERLGFLMHDVSRLRRTVFDDFMRPLGVTRSQWWVLAYLSRHDGMIQSDLANVLELGKAALGGLIDRLETVDLVHRGADENDRRAKRVYLSAKGAQIVREMVARNHDMSERILEGLDRQARLTLYEMLSRVKRNLQDIKNSSGSMVDVDGDVD